MRVPWFNWRAPGREDTGSWTACYAPHERSDDEIALALRLIPLYHVRLRIDAPHAPARLWWPLDWRATLIATIGAERTQRALRDVAERGEAILAVCPRELAEHYCDELARHALPCEIAPA